MDDDEIDNVAYDSEENEIDLKAEGVLVPLFGNIVTTNDGHFSEKRTN